MSSQAVSFQFSGDVVGGSSILYTATGRLLKSLSNGGVDFYAVAASIQLGKLIPLRQEREIAISQLLKERCNSRESYLSKALRLGWGYTDLPHEMARTRAGLSALNIIGVFATEVKPFEAAQALSTLMEISGCDPESLPALDCLKVMIEFLAPFVIRSSFDSVLNTVNLACLNTLKKYNLTIPAALLSRGSGSDWARVVKHLVATSEASENAHITVARRGAWLSAFSSHILNMSTRIYFEDLILWESSGTNGSVCFYMFDSASLVTPEKHSLTHFTLEYRDPQISTLKQLPQMLRLDQVFEYKMHLITMVQSDKKSYHLNEAVVESIQEAICRFSGDVFEKLSISAEGKDAWPINGYFPLRKEPLREVLRHFGMKEEAVNLVSNYSRMSIMSEPHSSISTMCKHLTYFHPKEGDSGHLHLRVVGAYLCRRSADNISTLCEEVSTGRSPETPCLCGRVANFIIQLTNLAVALAQVSYDANTLRVRATSGCYPGSLWNIDGGIPVLHYHTLFNYLVNMLDSHDMPRVYIHQSLAWSAGGVSVYTRALLEAQCFDHYGRALVIAAGNLAFRGIRRNQIIDCTDDEEQEEIETLFEGTMNTYDANTALSSCFAKGPITYEPIFDIRSDTIRFGFKLVNTTHCDPHGESLQLGLFHCITHFLQHCKHIGHDCGHEGQREYIVKTADSSVILHTFGTPSSALLHKDWSTMLLFAVAGKPLSQIMQVFLLRRKGYYPVLQGRSCLDCFIRRMKSPLHHTAIIMS